MYTKSQIRFWVVLILICTCTTYKWFVMFRSDVIAILDVVGTVTTLALVSAFVQWWGTGIVRSKRFWSRKYKDRKYPGDIDCWNTIQTGVPGVNIILFLVPILFAYFLSSLL